MGEVLYFLQKSPLPLFICGSKSSKSCGWTTELNNWSQRFELLSRKKGSENTPLKLAIFPRELRIDHQTLSEAVGSWEFSALWGSILCVSETGITVDHIYLSKPFPLCSGGGKLILTISYLNIKQITSWYDILSNSPPAFPSDKICPDRQPQAPYFDAFHTFFTVAVRNSQDHPMVYIPPKRSYLGSTPHPVTVANEGL